MNTDLTRDEAVDLVEQVLLVTNDDPVIKTLPYAAAIRAIAMHVVAALVEQ